MATPTTEQLTALAAALGLGGLLKSAIDWLAARRKAAQKEPADLTRAAADFQEALTAGGKELIEWLRQELKFLRGQVVVLEGQVSDLKTEVSESQTAHNLCEQRLAEIDKMMREHPAAPAYAPSALSGLVPPKSKP